MQKLSFGSGLRPFQSGFRISSNTNWRSEIPISMNGAAPNGGQAQGTVPTRPRWFLWMQIGITLQQQLAENILEETALRWSTS